LRNTVLFFTAVLFFAVNLPAGTAKNADKQVEKEFRILTTADEGDGYLGVYLRDITTDDVEKLGLGEELGALVVGVAEGSPADDAGLRENDVVVEFQSQPVRSVRQFQRLVGETPPGRSVAFKVIRDGAVMSMNAVIGERESSRFFHRFRVPSLPRSEGPRVFRFPGDKGEDWVERIHEYIPWMNGNKPVLGIEGASMTDQMAEFMGIEQGEGVLVTAVLESTPAEQAGLKAGDVITAVEGDQVEDLGDLRASLKEGDLELEVVRNKEEMVLQVEIKGPEEKNPSRETLRM